MTNKEQAALYLKLIELEVPATRKCLERINANVFEYKPHPKSMPMGYLAQLVAEIPLWIQVMVEDNVIDFTTYKHAVIKTNDDLVKHFDENIEGVRKALTEASEEALSKTFTLRNGADVIMSLPLIEYIDPTINHWVHHRGQLTVYMRMNDIDVPSIYGPSADENPYKK